MEGGLFCVHFGNAVANVHFRAKLLSLFSFRVSPDTNSFNIQKTRTNTPVKASKTCVRGRVFEFV